MLLDLFLLTSFRQLSNKFSSVKNNLMMAGIMVLI